MSPVPEVFRTERLEARSPNDADEDFLVAMWSQPRVTDWLGGPRDATGVAKLRAHFDDLWRGGRHGVWILRDLADGDRLGWVLLHPMDFGGTRGTEVGWAMRPDRWGEGLTSEAAAQVVEIGFVDCGFDELLSGTMVENRASRRVMEKIGFVYDCDVVHEDLPHALYRLDRDTWEKSRG